MKQKKTKSHPYLIAETLIIILLIINFVLSGCRVTKQNNRAKTDSTQVNKLDSGNLKKTTNTDYKKDDWWKETIVFPTAKDCTVNHNYYTNPTTIIREGGSQTKVIDNTRYDSGWQKRYDSLQVKTQLKESTKKTEVLSFWQIAGIGLSCSLVVGVLLNFISKFKITRL